MYKIAGWVANSVDPDQTASDLGLHCLPLIQQFCLLSTGFLDTLFAQACLSGYVEKVWAFDQIEPLRNNSESAPDTLIWVFVGHERQKVRFLTLCLI